MAKTLNSWPSTTGTARRRYNWESWMDGQVWKLTAGLDFQVPPKTFRSIAVVAAKRRGVRIRSAIIGQAVIIQKLGVF